MLPIIPLGISDFADIRQRGHYYVDKTQLISELLAGQDRVCLFPRPRRFGKTLNMTMLQTFFDMKLDSRVLFDGLAVSRDPAAMAHLNQYPTLFLTLKDLGTTWESFSLNIKKRVSDLLCTHLPTLDLQQVPLPKREELTDARDKKATLNELVSVLATLSEQLAIQSGKRVVVLIDEYDNPIHKGHEGGYYSEVVGFIRGFLGNALKDNPHLELAVITGILRLGKESIYSGLNNLTVFSVLKNRFATAFGFTSEEVQQILVDFQATDLAQGVQDWYNGYQFGGVTIFNPWSILCRLKFRHDGFQPHWIGTSGNGLIEQVVRMGGTITVQDLDNLLHGSVVRRKVQENLAMADLTKTEESIWGLLLFSGYLTASAYDPETQQAELQIPNKEVRSFFAEFLKGWLGVTNKGNDLLDALLQENWSLFATRLSTMLHNILSYHDTRIDRAEWVYHIFVAGLLANLLGRYRIQSNGESGRGRYDLLLIPENLKDPGYVFEFKRPSKPNQNLTILARKALAQIENKDYAARLHEHGTTRIAKVGIAFEGSRLSLVTSTTDRSGTASKIETHEAGRVADELIQNNPTQPSANQKAAKRKSQSVEALMGDADPNMSSIDLLIKSFHQVKGLSVTAMADLDAKTQEHLHSLLNVLHADLRVVIAEQIRILQELRGDPVLDQAVLQDLSLEVLESMLRSLKPSPTRGT